MRSIFQSVVVLGEDVGEVGLRLQVAGVAALGLHVGDVAEELQRPVGPLGTGAAGDPDAPAPGALREPFELAAGLDPVGQVVDLVAGLAESAAEGFGEAPVRNPLLGAVGDEARDRPRVRGHARTLSTADLSGGFGFARRADATAPPQQGRGGDRAEHA